MRIKNIESFIHSPVVKNVGALYSVHIARVIIPLLTVPYLARVLGPEMWGVVAIAQSFGSYVNIFIEYGYNLSATREIAKNQKNLNFHSELLSGIIGAKLLFTILGFLVTIAVQFVIPHLKENPRLLWMSFYEATIMALNFHWYFQGIEKMRFIAFLDVLTQFGAAISFFIFIQGSQDGWMVPAIRGCAAMISLVISLYLIFRTIPFKFPSFRKIVLAIKQGWSMFIFRGAVSMYTVGNAFLLGFFVPPEFVGYYSGAEKISKSVSGLLQPINRALFPRFTSLLNDSPVRAARLAKLSLYFMMGVGAISSVLVFVASPFLIKIILGNDFDAAVGTLRIFALLPVLIAISNMLGIQWMLPLGLDKSFNKIIFGAGLINFLLVFLLAPRFAHNGMAWSVVAAETFVTIAVVSVLIKNRLSPITFEPKVNSELSKQEGELS